VLAKVDLVVVRERLVGVQARQERDSARITPRHLTVCSIELHATAGQPINIGRLDLRMAVGAEIAIEIIGYQEQHIQLGIGSVSGRNKCEGEREKKGGNGSIHGLSPQVMAIHCSRHEQKNQYGMIRSNSYVF
jgi:hypothetical protein